jgi:23S rRNA (adenine2503-C2)-methyltransferase
MAPVNKKSNIIDLNHAQLARWIEAQNLAPYRAGQILKWIYHHQADSFEVMTDQKKEIRTRLAHTWRLDRLHLEAEERSCDGSRKYLFRLADGLHIESVLIPERDHYTLCISSQVGCALGCRFCLTAQGGLVRNLTQGEIVSQVRDIQYRMDAPERLKNIVFMGMGEPLANYNNVVEALDILLNSAWGLGFSRRKVTVSTAGIASKIVAFGQRTPANLAVSLNATDDITRSRLMPINRKYPLAKLLDACRRFPLPPHRRITFEYILIKDVNASPQQARALADLLDPTRAKINLILFNPHPRSPFERPAEADINAFQEILHQHHFTAVVRRSKGQDISAACGQLRARLILS